MHAAGKSSVVTCARTCLPLAPRCWFLYVLVSFRGSFLFSRQPRTSLPKFPDNQRAWGVPKRQCQGASKPIEVLFLQAAGHDRLRTATSVDADLLLSTHYLPTTSEDNYCHCFRRIILRIFSKYRVFPAMLTTVIRMKITAFKSREV